MSELAVGQRSTFVAGTELLAYGTGLAAHCGLNGSQRISGRLLRITNGEHRSCARQPEGVRTNAQDELPIQAEGRTAARRKA